MEFTFRGANCIQISGKGGVLVTDANLASVGLEDPASNKVDVFLLTQDQFRSPDLGSAFVIDGPGEYEVKEFAFQGVASRAYTDEEGSHSTTMYRVRLGAISTLVLGHIHPSLSEEQLEEIGVVDIVVLPVGGNGYTLDAAQASKLVHLIGPRVVIPTHYASPGVKYSVEQSGIEEFAKELGVTPEKLDKYKIKGDSFPESLTLLDLERS